jgi:hypothetical protein
VSSSRLEHQVLGLRELLVELLGLEVVAADPLHLARDDIAAAVDVVALVRERGVIELREVLDVLLGLLVAVVCSGRDRCGGRLHRDGGGLGRRGDDCHDDGCGLLLVRGLGGLLGGALGLGGELRLVRPLALRLAALARGRGLLGVRARVVLRAVHRGPARVLTLVLARDRLLGLLGLDPGLARRENSLVVHRVIVGHVLGVALDVRNGLLGHLLLELAAELSDLYARVEAVRLQNGASALRELDPVIRLALGRIGVALLLGLLLLLAAARLGGRGERGCNLLEGLAAKSSLDGALDDRLQVRHSHLNHERGHFECSVRVFVERGEL